MKTLATVPVSIDSDGDTTVNIGDGGTVQNIRGEVLIGNTAPNRTDVNVDDSADNALRLVTMDANMIKGLAPAQIFYDEDILDSLTIAGGSGGNFIVVKNTPTNPGGVTTSLNSGAGADTVAVQATRGELFLDGKNGMDTVRIGTAGSVQGITGDVTVSNTIGMTALTVDDSADAVARIATIGADTITGLAPAAIKYVAHDVERACG